MYNLTPIEHKNQRVITTQQLAEVFETEVTNIKTNFSRNKEHFEEGRDFFLLQGEELQAFKRSVTDSNQADKFAPSLTLWTERGANRHSKILDTDQAWKQFDILEETYFKVKNNQILTAPTSIEDLIIMQAQSVKELKTRVQQLEETTQVIKDTFVETDENWLQWVGTSLNKVAMSEKFTALINKYQAARQESYTNLELRAGCMLGIRVRRAVDRAKETGATKKQLDSITKLHVIQEDKRLKEIYTTIVKEMLLAYVA